MYINKVTLIGNLTRDVELKALPNGQSVANFGLATNRSWKDAQGAKQEVVEFHNVVAFGKQADVIKQYCQKGSQLLVEGRLQTQSWDKDGVKHYKTEIVLEGFQFGKKSGDRKQVDDETGEVIPGTLPATSLNDFKGRDEVTEEELSQIPF